MAESPRATVQRTVDAASEIVFAALVDPRSVERWMFGEGRGAAQVIHIEVDPRPAGRFSFLVRRGDVEIDHTGEYLAFEPPRRLRFTWSAAIPGTDADTSEVEITLQPRADGCAVTLTHDLHPGWADFVAEAESSWGTMLDRLAALCQQAR